VSPDPVAGEVDEASRAAPVRDPLQRWLGIVFLLVLTVFTATAVSLVVYVLSMRDAPRTSVERQLAADEIAAREQPQNVENWARLALSYARAGQWTDAADAIARGRVIEKAAILDLTEADILRMKGDKAAIAAYDRAVASARAESALQAKELLEKKAVDVPPPNVVLIEALTGRAIALDAFGRTEEAVTQAEEALSLNLGRTAEAEAEYRRALTYVPDLDSAIEGLKKLGKER
jgi:tetratricopeptide (TPR) repeat protein